MIFHKDNLGQEITPGDFVLSVRSSTNYVPRMIVLKLTAQRVVTNYGNYEPNTLLVVTALLKDLEPTTVADLMKAHGSQISNALPTPAKTMTRYIVRSVIGHNGTSADPKFMIVFQVSYTTMDDFRRQYSVLLQQLQADGYRLGSYQLERSPEAYKRQRCKQVDGWSFSYALGTGSAGQLTLATLRKFGIDGLVTNEVMSIDTYNNTVTDEFVRYVPENIT